ncbi:hypothetical protein QUB68_29660 [Microcoleus sp. A006_D1]|uniref:hypothetical protein n=1 Tax=Microcoleus sp. A006_D1 TaxID=3055267 RepID=UPI002FCEBA36
MAKQPIPAVTQGTIELENGQVIELESPKGAKWLAETVIDPETGKEKGRSFRYESMEGRASFTARNQPVKGISYWYASKKVAGEVNKLYIGKPENVTIRRLEEVAEEIAKPHKKVVEKVAEKVAETEPKSVGEDSDSWRQAIEAQMMEMQKVLEELRGKLTA